MAGYTQVAPSEPIDADQDDLPGKDPEARQRERLINGVETGEDGIDGGGGRHRRRRLPAWLRTVLFTLATVACLVALLLLIKISFFDSFAEHDDEPTADEKGGEKGQTPVEGIESFRRDSSEYFLDASWDFDAPPTVREYNWVIRNIDANPDGVFRTMTTINGKFPGELIRCNEGDTIVVNVENQSVNATAIHWHGVFQIGSNHMDGTPGVTQCPIAPGRKFRYEFKITGQSGTYFYHGHQAADALDGLVGPIVIHARGERQNQRLPYATDRVVMLQDWYHDPSAGLLRWSLSPGSESSPVPNGALLNGANTLDCDLHPLRRCDNSSAVLPSFDLAAGQKHRLRLLNVGGFAWFQVSVDGHHQLPVTEVDGVDVEPAPESSVLIGPGQRYSIVLAADQADAAGTDAFWMRARMVTHCFAENVLPERGMAVAKAVIRYAPPSSSPTPSASSPASPPLPFPTTQDDSGAWIVTCKDMAPSSSPAFAPVPAVPAPPVAGRSYYFRVNLQIGAWRLERGFMNTSSYRPNLASPILHRAAAGLAAGNASFAVEGVSDEAFDVATEMVLSHGRSEVVDVVLQNLDEGNHPFHLHGHQLFVLGQGHGYWPGYAALGLASEGKGLLLEGSAGGKDVLANPTRRDVATVEGFGWALVRFVADHPGVWKFHCHMVWHGDAGMAVHFLSLGDGDGSLRTWEVPADARALCEAPLAELERGAAPPDSVFMTED